MMRIKALAARDEKKLARTISVVFLSPSNSIHFANMSESTIQLNSLEECLQKYIPAAELKEVNRILFGQREE